MGEGGGGGGGDPKKGRRVAIIGISSFLLVAMVVAAVTAGGELRQEEEFEANRRNRVAATVKAVQTVCHPTEYKTDCEESLLKEAGNTTDPKELIKLAFNITITRIADKFKDTNLLEDLEKEPRTKMALETCKQLMDLSIFELTRALEGMNNFDVTHLDRFFMNIKVWLSGALTYQDTCLDGFENTTSDAGKKMQDLLTSSSHMTSNALAIVSEMADSVAEWNITSLFGRRLLEHHDDNDKKSRSKSKRTPSWVDPHLLNYKDNPNVTVALDGTGDFSNITLALQRVPKKNKKPFVIYIKEGVYHQYVEVKKKMTHVVFVGDGAKKTIITGSKNFIDGVNTYRTASAAIQGDYFVAINIGFENTAGPHKHQAVALRVQSDKSVFYNCSMDGYQDTLYVHNMRQFYRDCTISGTIDFVFGNALAVFQNCTFVVRKPMENQQCIVTAQGRKEKQQPSGIIIQGGSIVADPEFYNVRFEHKSYLARPWKNFSRTIFMDTYIDDLIHPDGYLPWQGLDGPLYMDTCFYAEYHNLGPGSDKSKRVDWPGILNLNSKAARLFAPSKFFHGSDWIEVTGIPYFRGVPEHHRHKKTNLTWVS